MEPQENPFFASIYNGKPSYWLDVQSRLDRVKNFTPEQCRAALAMTDLQKTVRKAVEIRLRKLER